MLIQNRAQAAAPATETPATASRSQEIVVEKEAKNPFHVDGAEKSFLDYMKKSIAERMEDAWLASRGLTRKDLESMPTEKRDAIKKAMAEDIKNRLKQEAENKNKESAGL